MLVPQLLGNKSRHEKLILFLLLFNIEKKLLEGYRSYLGLT